MTEHHTTPNDPIERELASMSTWRGERTELWRSALERVEGERARVGVLARLTARPWRAAAAVALGGIIIAIATVVSDSTTQPVAVPAAAESVMLADAAAPSAMSGSGGLRGNLLSQNMASDLHLGREVSSMPEERAVAAESAPETSAARSVRRQPDRADANFSSSAADRQIIRRAAVEIAAPDIATAFAAVQSGLDEAQGDMVEQSSQTGEGRSASALLTIRVRADRLDAVLAGVRQAGKVRSEWVTAEDVTSQVVDLEARLRNEQRFEADLLDLSSNRADAPLDQVLQVRRSVAEVRERIERMVAQRQRLGLDVAMSTVNVSIKPEHVEAREARGLGLREYVGNGLRSAWQRGLISVADSFTWLVRVLVGGAVWWATLAVGVIAGRVWWKRRIRRRES